MIKELFSGKSVREFFSLNIIKNTKIQLHMENSITEVNIEQFLVIFELIAIENIFFKSNLITNLLKNEIKKIIIEVVFNENIKKIDFTVTKEIKEKKIRKEVGYVNIIDLNKMNITIPSLDILEIELLFDTLLMYLRIIKKRDEENGNS
jgi:hypothetical protein